MFQLRLIHSMIVVQNILDTASWEIFNGTFAEDILVQ